MVPCCHTLDSLYFSSRQASISIFTFALIPGDVLTAFVFRVQNSRRLPAIAGTLVTLAGDFHGSDRKLHLLIGEINVTGTRHKKYFISMNAQRGLNLFFNVLLARSRLREGGERRQSGREKKKKNET